MTTAHDAARFHRRTASLGDSKFHSDWTSYVPPGTSGADPARGRTTRHFAAPATDDTAEVILARAYGFEALRRPVPSAGGLYGLSFTVVQPDGRAWRRVGTFRRDIGIVQAEDLQDALGSALTGLVTTVLISADWAQYVERYGSRGYRFALIEVGHVSQVVLEQTASLGLASASIGGFDEERVIAACGNEIPSVAHVIGVGHS